MSLIRPFPTTRIETTLQSMDTFIGEAAGNNAAAVVTIAVPVGLLLTIDLIIAGYQGGAAASQTFAIVGKPAQSTVAFTYNATVTNTPGILELLLPQFDPNQNVTLTLPAGGGAGNLGYVSCWYHYGS